MMCDTKEKKKKEKLDDEKVSLLVKCFRRAKLPFIMSIICFLIGILFVALSIHDNFKIRLLIILIGYIPCLVFITITLLKTKFYEKNGVKMFLGVLSKVLTFFLLIYYFVALFVCLLLSATNPVTDPKYYNYYVTDERLEKVFPAKIPTDAKNIEFYYAPGVLQGGTNYSLYYVDDNMTKEQFDKKYKDKALWIGHKKEYTEKEGLLSGAFAYTPAYCENENDYIVYLIKGNCDDSGYCNHGNFLIAAFNENTNEVIFRSEEW